MRVIDQIHDRSVFTPAERQIAKYLEENCKEATGLSLGELSDKLFVSKSTIIRFCKKLGFKGHKELCIKLSSELNTFFINDHVLNASFPYEEKDSIDDIAEKTFSINQGSLIETYEHINKEQLYNIAKTISSLNEVYVFALEENLTQAMIFTCKCRDLGIKAHYTLLPGMSSSQAYDMKPNSVAVMLSYHEKDAGLVRVAKIIKKKGCQLILITGPFKGPLRSFANDIVEMSVYEPEPKSIDISSRNSMNLIIDLIYGYIYMLNLSEYDKSIVGKYKDKQLSTDD